SHTFAALCRPIPLSFRGQRAVALLQRSAPHASAISVLLYLALSSISLSLSFPLLIDAMDASYLQLPEGRQLAASIQCLHRLHTQSSTVQKQQFSVGLYAGCFQS
ncbi:unnamed protein product, partial [Pleuronectes platessa]